VTTNIPDPDPEAPMPMLRASVRALHEAVRGGSLTGGDLEELRRLVERLERVTAAAAADGGFDPIARLRRQVGSRTVSRLVEICDDPIPIMGPDRRMAAQGA
jgi:hypothetical protein